MSIEIGQNIVYARVSNDVAEAFRANERSTNGSKAPLSREKNSAVVKLRELGRVSLVDFPVGRDFVVEFPAPVDSVAAQNGTTMTVEKPAVQRSRDYTILQIITNAPNEAVCELAKTPGICAAGRRLFDVQL